MSANRDLVASHYAASARGDLGGMLKPFAPDIEWTEMAGSELAGTYVGADEIVANVFGPINEQWLGFTVEVDELIDADETIVMVGSYQGTYKRTGKAMCARVAHVWRVTDGAIVGFEQFVDTAALCAATV